MGSKQPDFGDGFSPGKIFIGGLANDTTTDMFVKYFAKYGEITDYVIMKDRETGRPRGFGFIEYADPFVVDTVMAETHVINGKQVEIKRTIPKGDLESVDFKTKKIFVGGIPPSVTKDELKAFFSKYGEVVEHEIIRDHATQRSRGFGFVVFDSELVVDNILVNGNMIDMDGTQVEVKEAEPKKRANSAPSYGSEPWGYGLGGSEPWQYGPGGCEFDSEPREYGPSDSEFGSKPWGYGPHRSEPRGCEYGDIFGGYDDCYGGYGGGGYGPSYRSLGGLSSRFGDYGGYGPSGSEFGNHYGDFGGDYRGYWGGKDLLSYSSCFSSFGGGGYRGSWLGGYDHGGAGYGSYGGGGHEPGAGWSYGAGGPYRRWAGYGGGNRYHPYGR